jgi:hypothetical protein
VVTNLTLRRETIVKALAFHVIAIALPLAIMDTRLSYGRCLPGAVACGMITAAVVKPAITSARNQSLL